MSKMPATLLPALHALQTMLCKLWPEAAAEGRIPLAFWQIDDDVLLFDALQYLPANVLLHGGSPELGYAGIEAQSLPEGFRVLLAIFRLEDEFANEGWTGIGNLDAETVQQIVSAYDKVGLPHRSEALARVWAAFQNDPDAGEDALVAAAADALPDIIDDDPAFQAIARFVRTDPETRFGTLAE